MCQRRLWLYIAAIGVPLIGGVVTLWLEIAVKHTPEHTILIVLGGVAFILAGSLLSGALEEWNVRYQRKASIYQRLQQPPSDPSL